MSCVKKKKCFEGCARVVPLVDPTPSNRCCHMACMSSRRAIGVFVFLHCLWCCFVLLLLPFASALFALRSCLCYFSHSSGIICRFVSCADRVVSPTLSRTLCCCCNYFVASPFSAIQFSLYGIYVVGSSLSSIFSPRCSLHGRLPPFTRAYLNCSTLTFRALGRNHKASTSFQTIALLCFN